MGSKKTYDADQIPGVVTDTSYSGSFSKGAFSGSNAEWDYPVVEKIICKECHEIHETDDPVDLGKVPANAIRIHCSICDRVTQWHGKPNGDLDGRIIK